MKRSKVVSAGSPNKRPSKRVVKEMERVEHGAREKGSLSLIHAVCDAPLLKFLFL